jgi:seryl-tRNA synthetase
MRAGRNPVGLLLNFQYVGRRQGAFLLTPSQFGHLYSSFPSIKTSGRNQILFKQIDFHYLKDNFQLTQENIRNRKCEVDLHKVITLQGKMEQLQTNAKWLRIERNKLADLAKKDKGEETRTRGKEIRLKLQQCEQELKECEIEMLDEANKIPNRTHPDVPVGGEEAAKMLKESGSKPEFGFPIKDHVALSSELDLINFEAASRCTGNNFCYLKNEAALMELALMQWSVQKAISKGFTPISTPDLVRRVTAEACGFQPREANTQTYNVEGFDLSLVATAEIPLAGYYMNCILAAEHLPIRMVAFGHCFRAESGSFGLRDRGLYRLHQFTKVELFALCAPEQSESLHQEILDIQEEIFSALGLHYRVMDMPTEDLGAPAYRKFDIEAWMPGRGSYGEVSSTSNCTDYQSRRLNICYKSPDGGRRSFVHTVNGTACAIPRTLLAVLETHQQSDGSVVIPAPLRPFMAGQERIQPKHWQQQRFMGMDASHRVPPLAPLPAPQLQHNIPSPYIAL